MSLLYTQISGDGPPLIMLHGWAMHGGIFHRLTPALSQSFTTITLDLPGHGQSPPLPGLNNAEDILNAWIEAILESVPERATWLGWSLGGRLATHLAARFPERVEKLILIASNPQFVSDEHWPHGMDPVFFQTFADSVHADYQKTLLRFLSLQTRGSDHSREELRELKERVFAHGEPDHESVFQGLELLRSLKIGSVLEEIHCPTLVMLGERDTLVPRTAGDGIFDRLEDGQLITLKGAGHAPFLSHASEVLNAINGFCESTHR